MSLVSVSRPKTIGSALSGDRSERAKATIIVLGLLLVTTAIFCVSWGASDVSTLTVISHWLGFAENAEIAARDQVVVETIRLPRVLLGMMVGAALAVSGAVLQGMFRNPLADPGIIGISSGAGFGAACAIVLGSSYLAYASQLIGPYLLPTAAFLGGLCVTLLLYRISTRSGHTSISTMLLGGVVMEAFARAATGILFYVADDEQLRDLTFWGLGSVAGATWSKLSSVGPVIAVPLLAMPFLARSLNALSMGEAAAFQMGFSVQTVKRVGIVAVAAATGASVSVTGSIGFVGIVVPHLLRLMIGPDHRYLLPASALLGALFLILADAVSRTIVAPAELPIGIVTALIGAPFFFWILLRRRGVVDL